MSKPSLGALLVLKPKGSSDDRPPSEKPSRRGKVAAALRAAWKAKAADDEDGFVDAMEGALGFSQEPDADEG